MEDFFNINIFFPYQEGKQPNIVLIVADDFGYNDVGYHNPYVLTPNIDELARTGSQIFTFL